MSSDKKRILLIDDDPMIVHILVKRCTELGHQADSESNGLHALMSIARQQPDLVITEIDLPGADGLSVAQQLRKDPQTASVPIIFLTGRTEDETIQQCRQLSAYHVAKGMDAWERVRVILSQVFSPSSDTTNEMAGDVEGIDDLGIPPLPPKPPRILVQEPGQETPHAPSPEEPIEVTPIEAAPAQRGPRVLIIEDDPAFSRALQIRLRAYGVEVFRAFNGTQGLEEAWAKHPDLIIADYTLPEGYGNYVLRRLKEDMSTKNTPVFIVTGRRMNDKVDYALERDMTNLGASRYFTKPIEFDELISEMRDFINIPMAPLNQAPSPLK